MAISKEVRRLERAWKNETAWPKRLKWIEIDGLRGWNGRRVEFPFPIVAIVGENGSGKSSIIQAAASVYREGSTKGGKYASEFFPSTAWDQIVRAEIRYGYKEGDRDLDGSIRKPSERWKGNVERPIRNVEFFDLSRVLPVSGRVGYAKIAKSKHVEFSATLFEADRLSRLSEILGRKYTSARMALSDVDEHRLIPVLQRTDASYSGYHQGQGETTIAELIQADLPKYSLVLIDEIESSLHPRAQRRLIRDLANACREQEIQIILTTHSPYILEELPNEARLQIFEQEGQRQIMIGVSPQFAMTKMDDVTYPECELYVEDEAAKIFVTEILSQKLIDLAQRCMVIPFGASSVGYQLGRMVNERRWTRPVGVLLDGDCAPGDGCFILPGGDAPEQVVMGDLQAKRWGDLWILLARDVSLVAEACDSAMAIRDHHEWTKDAGRKLALSPHVLWHAMCAEWVKKCLAASDRQALSAYIEDRLVEYA